MKIIYNKLIQMIVYKIFSKIAKHHIILLQQNNLKMMKFWQIL